MDLSRIVKQIAFFIEIDTLKSMYRRAILIDRSRQENDAEHSWHLAMMACILFEHSNDNQIDLLRVITAEEKFSKALDRLSPLFLNYYTEGYTWKKRGITPEMVISRNMEIREGSHVLWEYAKVLIDNAVENGFL